MLPYRNQRIKDETELDTDDALVVCSTFVEIFSDEFQIICGKEDFLS